MKKLLLFISFLLLSFISSAHTVQTFWELRDDGTIRFWLEHWHNDVTDSNLGNFYIVVNQGSGNQNISGSGYYNNIPFGNLPVQGTINNRVQCSGQANTYNDWVYYDFLPVKCNEEVTIKFVEGPPAETEEACTNGLFGYSITQTFYDRSAPTITASDLNVGTNQTNCEFVAGSFSNVSVAENCDSNPTVVYSVEGNVIDPQTFVFPLGTTTVSVNATDNTGYPSNNSSSANFDVIVSDNQPPAFTSFPADIQVNVDAGQCDAVVTYSSPTASDDCDSDPTISLTTGFASGSAFPLGATTVTYEVSDGTNKTTQSFTVTVIDNELPTLSLQDITRKLTSIDGLTVPATEFISAVNDNCSYTITPANFTFDCTNVGTQQVTITAKDGAGNEVIKNAQITIENPDALVQPSEGSTVVSSPGNYTVIDSNLLILLSDNVNGATVSINENFQSGDELRLATGFTLPSGVSGSYNTSTGVFTISGAMTSQELQDIFQNIQFRTTSSNVLEREIVFNIGAGVSNSDNNHYYEYVDGAFTWQQAKADAATKTLNGLQGYLATITSASENQFILTKLSGDGWIGGSDSFSEINSAAGNPLYNTQTEAEGKWYWVTGPEAGTQFSEVSQSVNGQFENWNASEPNNSGSSEHSLQIYYQNGGLWNDLNGGNSLIGYIVEYGGLSGDQSCFQYSGVKTLELNTPPQISEISDIENCPSETYSFTVEITDAEDSYQDLEVKATSDNQAFIPNANISVVHNGTNYEVTIVPVEDTQASTNITITATDSGNLSSTKVFKFTAVDNVDPVVETQNITVQLDAEGAATITPVMIDNGSSDNCEIDTMSLDITDFSCSNLGQNTVTLTVKDKSGNESSETATVIVEDKISPQILKPSQLVFESDSELCGALIDLRFNTQDNCASTGNIAYNGNAAGGLAGWNVTLNGGNGWAVNGNSFRTSYSLAKKSQVIDLLAQGYSKELLDTAPEISISENYRGGWPDFNDTYFFRVELRDEKGEVIESFNSGTLTANNTWQTVSSSFNDYGTGLRYIFIEHGGKDVEFWAGHYGTEIGNLNVQVNAPGVTPNLPVQQTAGIPLSDEFPVGGTVNSYVVMDYAGNTSTTSFTITVEDKTLPKVVTQNITVQLDENGQASVSPDQINDGSTDNCEISEISFSKEIIEFAEVNENENLSISLPAGKVVTAVKFASYGTPTGSSGEYNLSSCHAASSQAIVEGYALGKNSFTIPASNGVFGDPCSGTVKRLYVAVSYLTEANDVEYTCDNIGENTVFLTVVDKSGNANSAEATVTVEDNVAPVAVIQNITVQLDAEGNATITPEDIDNGSSDACGISEMSLDNAIFDCSNVGENTVVLTVEDNNGNTTSSEAIVTVEDNVAPVVVTQNITVQLDAEGNATITPEMIDNGSSDACGISEMTLDIDIFDCSNVGENTVVLTVEDNNGNKTSSEAIVTVEDNVAPVVAIQNITVQL
ncbi:HYR domain-containing protein, partial [Salinimicrobium sp. MT39]